MTTYSMELENKIAAQATRIKYLNEQNLRLQTANMLLRRTLYGADIADEIHEVARLAVNTFFALELDTRTNKLEFVKAREFYYAILRKHTRMSLKQIANSISICQDHATIIHSLHNFDKYYETEKRYKSEFDRVLLLIFKEKI